MADDVVSPVSVRAFAAMRQMDVDAIAALSEQELRPLLPRLVRMDQTLCVPIDAGADWLEKKKQILMKLSSTERANSIVSLLSVDFHSLDGDVRKEMLLRSRVGPAHAGESGLVGAMSDGLVVEYERSSAIAKFRVVLSEYLATQSHARSLTAQPFPAVSQRSSELLDNDVYLNEICDVLVIAIVELPTSMSLIDVVETLIFTRRGSELICRLVANFPESFLEVCSAIISNGEKQDEDLLVSRSRIRTLRMLCKMNPDKALVVRALAADSCRMPAFAVLISIDYHKTKGSGQGNELVSFISSILLGGEERVKLWFSQYLWMGQKKIERNQATTVMAMRRELQRYLKQLQDGLSSATLVDSQIIEAAALLRLYCALHSMPGMSMKFNEEETAAILNMITSTPPATPSGVKLVSLFLCVLISCPSLIASPAADKRAVAWLQRLVREETYFGHVCQIKSSFEEMLLLIAIHFHSGQIAAISDLVCSSLGMKPQIRSANLTRLRAMFTQEIFPEEKIASHAVKVPVTADLTANIAGFLPAHCIYQLLKSRAFSKHKVPIRDWIFRQICHSKAPVHPILPLMIEAFVTSVVTPSAKSLLSATNEPISEADLLFVFKHQIFSESSDELTSDQTFRSLDGTEIPGADLLTTQLLLLYYLLLYQDVWLSQRKQQALIKVSKYSSELMSRVPVFYLIQEARRDQANYGVFFPPLLRLVTAHGSHLCLVSDWLNTTRLESSGGRPVPRAALRSLGQSLASGLSDLPASAKEVIQLLDRLLAMPLKSLWFLAPTFVSAMPDLLTEDVPKMVLEKSKKLWWNLNAIFPDNLWVMTVNALRSGSAKDSNRGKLSWNDVVLDPLYVLRCDERVLRCAELMEITLHILNAFLAASRTMFNSHLMEKPSKNADEEMEREELKRALIASQESAAIQILLESCMATPDESEAGLLLPLREVQGLICTHLHQLFISDPNLAKLVHFQTYASELLPLTVSAIPSMHICLDFLPELLSQPDLGKCVFAIELCSFLSLQYSTTKCLCVAKLCFNVSSTLLSLLSADKRSSFFMPVLPSLVRMCTAFPPLREDAVLLMKQLRQVTLSKLSATSCTFISARTLTRAYDLAKRKYPQSSQFLRFCSTLPDDEALYLVIHESAEKLDQNLAS